LSERTKSDAALSAKLDNLMERVWKLDDLEACPPAHDPLLCVTKRKTKKPKPPLSHEKAAALVVTI
jgi:hypothetical protein